MQHGYCGCEMHVKCKAESIDDRILLGHAERIFWVLNACNNLAEGVDNGIFLGHAARILWVSIACTMFGRKHR